jgi:hypothetical protein
MASNIIGKTSAALEPDSWVWGTDLVDWGMPTHDTRGAIEYSHQNTNYSDADVITFLRQLDLLALIACSLPQGRLRIKTWIASQLTYINSALFASTQSQPLHI